MIKVLKENPVPTETIFCPNCRSELEYGNGDLIRESNGSNASLSFGICQLDIDYALVCPVCGVKFYTHWING